MRRYGCAAAGCLLRQAAAARGWRGPVRLVGAPAPRCSALLHLRTSLREQHHVLRAAPCLLQGLRPPAGWLHLHRFARFAAVWRAAVCPACRRSAPCAPDADLRRWHGRCLRFC